MNTPASVSAQQLLQIFFQAPLVNSLLVYEDNEYLGMVFKKDIQLGIQEGVFDLELNINFIEKNEVANFLIREEKDRENLRIPVIDKQGHLITIMTFREFECQFAFHRFLDDFHMDNIWDNLDHPLLITDHFKKVLYLNKEAFLLARKDLLGTRIQPFLKLFSMEIKEDRMLLTHIDRTYELVISLSQHQDFKYQVYQLYLL